MTQTFVDNKRVPATLVKAGPCVVTQIKTEDRDGYWSVQLGFGKKRLEKFSKPLRGHLKAAVKGRGKSVGEYAPCFLKEIKTTDKPDLKVGDEIKVSDIFSVGDTISVAGISKGKGFAGVVKRWGFAGGPRTHGQGDRLRAPGSIGQGTTPGRVHKGKKMAGRMGGDKITLKNVKVISVGGDKNELLVSGSVPGNANSLLVIKKLSSRAVSSDEKPAKVEEGEKVDEVQGDKTHDKS